MESKDTNYKKSYSNKGTILVSKNDKANPISKEDLNELLSCCNEVEKEFVEIGDAGESNNLLVGRFMTDVKKPEVVKNPFSEKVISILGKKKVFDFIKKSLALMEIYF